MDPVRELPYGPAALRPRKQAGQMAASDYRQDPTLLLHLLGRPQMETGTAAYRMSKLLSVASMAVAKASNAKFGSDINLHRRASSVAASRAHDPERVEGVDSPAG